MAGNDAYEPFEDKRIRHLEMIQTVIARLGNDAFIVKGWAITVAGAFFGFAVTTDRVGLAWASFVPTLLFWALDANFLRAERLFRILYAQVVEGEDIMPPFFMSASSPAYISQLTPERRKSVSRWTVFWRPTLAVFYGALLAGGMLVILFTR